MTEPAVWAEVRPATVAGLLRFRAAERPERVAFTFLADGEVEAERLTYAELDRRARAIAVRLRRTVAPGERALLLYPPGLEFIAAFFGCLYAGVVAVPAYPPRARDRAQTRLRAIARDAEPKAALTTGAILRGLAGFEGRAEELAALEWIASDALAPEELEAAEAPPEPSPEAVAFLQYTSGSTAAPKGVMVTHANLLHNERMIGEAFGQDEGAVVVGWLPLYHDMGLIGNVLQPVHAGATCVLMSPVAFLQRPARWLEAISRYRATTSGGPNFAYELCARKVVAEERSRLDLSSWRVAFNGAEPVREATLARFAETFGPCGFRREAFFPCYGLAEATLFVTGGAVERSPRVLAVDAAALERHEVVETAGEARRLVSCGRAWGEQRVMVVEPETGLACPPGRVGEIWIAGPSVARGYWRNAEATARDFGAVLTGLPDLPTEVDGPFLRTGDLGFVAGGELYVTGRIKDLVILRGRNHYPQDLELTAESSHPDLRAGSGAAFSVDVEGEERLVLVQEVERRLRADISEAIEAIRRAVAAEHEVQVWEVVLVRPGGVPKTSSGKVQRGACRAAYLAGELPVVGRSAVPSPPDPLSHPLPATGRGGIEGWLRESAARLLGVAPEALDSGRPLTGLGLDSLSAVELKGQAEAAFGVEVPLAELLQGASLGELAELLEAGAPCEELPPVRPIAREGDQPVSYGQRSLWFLERLAPEAGAYNIAVAARVVAGELDVAALRRALERLVARHEALRTVFPAPDGEPVQRVLSAWTGLSQAGQDAQGVLTPRPPLPSPDLPPPGEGEKGDSLLVSPSPGVWVGGRWERGPGGEDSRVDGAVSDTLLQAEAWRPFDLERGPLLRVAVEGDRVLFVVHHIAADFASLAVAARELSALYREETGGPAADLPPLSLTPIDFAAWQAEVLAGARGEALLAWWRERLAALPDLDLPTDRPRPPVQTWRGAGRAAVLPPAVADAVRALAGREGATLFTVLLAAFQAQLGRYTGQDDFAVGTPTAGRARPELAGLVGYFVNPVALRADLAGEPPFTDLLARTRERTLAALARADLPFALLAERLQPVRDPARPPLFQVMLVLQTARPQDDPGLAAFALGEAGARIGLGGLVLEAVPLAERRAQFELILRLAEETGDGGLRVSLEYNADLFEAATASRIVEHFGHLLAGAAADPSRPWTDLPLLGEAERRQILDEWSGAGRPAADTDQTLHGLFEAWVARAPQAPALVFEGEVLSYGELDARAERLAGRLRRRGVGPEVLVGLCAERSLEMVVGILGVLKAGGAWLPLDPSYPRERLAQLLSDAAVPVLLAQAGALPALPSLDNGETRVLLLDGDEEETAALLAEGEEGAAATADNLAYVLYTSGSTGIPKGVAVPHRGVVNRLLRAREAYGLGPGDAMLQRAAGGFDVSVWEIFGPLSSGARVVLARPGGQREPRYLARLLDEQRVTLANFTPAALEALLEEGDLAARADSLRQVFVGAEALPRDLPARFFGAGLRAPLDNMYGPTEASIDLLWYSCRPGAPLPGGATVPVGRPIVGTWVQVLDARLAPVPAGIPGELWLGGLCLARGYLGRPDLTAERFLPDPLAVRPGERLYRTGDLARWLPHGNVELLGRVDLQVKVRGVRVEPGEVEAVLRGHPAVREVAVAPSASVRQSLVAYVVWDAPAVFDARELRGFLAARLPEAMVPAAFVPVAELPRTPGGKLDRRALASLTGISSGPAAAPGQPPRTPVEQLVAGLWSELLGVERIGVHDDFFELGGHSLLVTRMLLRLTRLFGIELPVSAAFQASTVAALAERIETALGAAAAPPLRPVPRDRFPAGPPLSFAQRRLWFLDRLQPGSPVYNLPGAVRLAGPLDRAALASAFTAVLRRHEALRTVFRLQGDEPVQEIGGAPAAAALPVVDLGGLAAGLRRGEAERLARREAVRPFDLAAGPLCRAALLRLAPGEHLLLVNLHHAVADGWSLGLFLRELAALYEGLPLPAPPIQYADYAVWQREWMQGEVLESQLAYWRRQLADLPVLELPTDRPRPAIRELRGGLRAAVLPAGLADAVERIASRQRVTWFMELLAAFQVLLRRYTGEVSVPVGSPVANRQRPEVEGLIGFFANTLVLRAAMADDPPFDVLLARVREACLEAYAHQDIPFERLVEELRPERDLSQTPLFQVMLVLEEPLPRLHAGALELAPERIETGTAKFDLTLTLAPAPEGGLASILEYDSALFDAATIDRMLGHWRTLLAGIAAEPAAPVSALPLLQAAETEQVLRQWSAAGTEPGPDLCLHELFAEQARRTPAAEALVAPVQAGETGAGGMDGDLRLTYRELADRAGRLAAKLRRLGVGPEVRVGVCLERSADLVVSLLAVLEAGGTYVPLDPAYPRERLELVLADSSASVLLAAAGGPGADLGPATGLVRLDPRAASAVEALPAPVRAAPGSVSPRNLAYLIYTSGSTGRPKGVAVEHRSAVALVRWARQLFTPGELAGVLASTSVCFDLSVFELFVPLACGGKVILARNALELPDLAAASEVTLVNTVPSAMTELVRGGLLPAALRTVNLAGEPLQRALVDRLYEVPGLSRVYNLYGPSEDTTYSTWELVPRDGGAPLIGRPIAGSRAYLLDARAPWRMAPVPAGVPGELLLGGDGLARCYLDRPDLTAERFVPDPFAGLSGGEPGERLYRTGDLARWRPDGRLEFLGRMDHQVKVRGFRIELGEIEAALARHPGVREAVVTAREAALVAYVVPAAAERAEPGGEPPASLASSLRAWLAGTLPQYMLPSAWVTLPALPLTPNGKVDRRALPAPGAGEAEPRTPPRTPAEERLAEIWREVLGHGEVGIHDDFFELGGHSLLATRVLARVAEVFGVELPLAALFQAPTVAALAESLATLPVTAQPLAAAAPEGRLPLSFAQHRLWLIDRLEPGSPAYNLWVAVRFGGDLREDCLERALAEILRRHEPLRTVFAVAGQESEQVILPPPEPGALAFSRIDLTGLPPDRRDAARREELRAESLRPFDLARGPVVRFLLARLGAGEHLLMATFHHIAADGWSLEVFFRELAALYAAAAAGQPSPLPEPALRYADYAVAQRRSLSGGALAGHLAYWRRELAGLPVLELPADRPRPPARTYRGASLPFDLPADLVDGLNRLAHAEGATLFMALLAGFSALLARVAGEDDFAVGVPTAGRDRVETEGMIGLFINTLPLRMGMADDPAFGALVRRVRSTVLAGQAHEVPFEKLVDELQPERSTSVTPLFQVLFAFLSAATRERVEMPGLTLALEEVETAAAKLDLALAVHERDGRVHGWIEYATDLFEPPSAARLLRHWLALLESAVAEPGRRLGDLVLLSDAERRQLLAWSGAAETPATPSTVLQRFEQRARETPEATALVAGGEHLSYGELNRRAHRLARHLRRAVAGGEERRLERRIGLRLERSPAMVEAILAVWKAGAAYVPLAPSLPEARLAWMAEDSGIAAVITCGEPPEWGGQAILVDRELPASPEEPEGAPEEEIPAGAAAQDLACLIYTSGTTGRPKGVMVEHRSLWHTLQGCAARFGFDAADRMPHLSPFSFDISLFELFGPLTAGGAVELLTRDEVLDLPRLTAAIRRATRWHAVPGLMRRVVESLAESAAAVPGLRTVFVGGERVPPDLLRAMRWVFPGAELVVLYGPTEASIVCSAHRVPAGDVPGDRSAIGGPLPGARLLLLDRWGNLAPPGIPGEIHVGGAGVSRGYHGRPELTAKRYVAADGEQGGRLYRTGDLARWLPDGELEFLGREDEQVKIRGHRIELEEIEAVLARHPGVREAVVVAREDPRGDRRLVGYVVPSRRPAPAAADLRSALQETLPDYMVPWTFVEMEALPLTANGKVDRKALSPPESRGEEGYVAPRNKLERAIATVWREVLGLSRVGVHDNFFELGGNSLLVVNLRGRLEQVLGNRDLSVMDLFRYSTVDALARHLAAGEARRETATDQVRARTRTRRESLQQLNQARSQRRGRTEREE